MISPLVLPTRAISTLHATQQAALGLCLTFACFSVPTQAQEALTITNLRALPLESRAAIANLVRQQPANRQGPLTSLLPHLAGNSKARRAGYIVEQVPANRQPSSELLTAGLFSGPDVRYTLVAAPPAETQNAPSTSKRYTLTYASEVAGTDLIYNVSGSFLQGKARPFDISLAPGELALFCILPFQIEGVRGEVQAQSDRTIYAVSFHSAMEKPIQGQLPVALVEQVHSGEEFVHAYTLTDGYGRYSHSLSPKEIANLLEKKSRFKVRSLLCDLEFELPLVAVQPN